MDLEPTTHADFYDRLLRDTFGRDLADADAHLVFVILHYYRVVLSRPQVLAEYAARPDLDFRVIFGPLDPRRCAEALAGLWSGGMDIRAEPSHWVLRWRGAWGEYVRLRHLTPAELARLGALSERDDGVGSDAEPGSRAKPANGGQLQ